MKKEFILSPSKKKSKIEGFPPLKSCLTDIKGFNKVLLPIVKFDGSVVNEKWEGIPFTFIIQNVDVSRIDFRLEEGKYQLLTPLKLRKLEAYDASDIKREYLQTSVDKIEKVSYNHVDQYSNDGMLQHSGSFSHDANRRVAYGYDQINGKPMPVTKTIQYYMGNGEWLDSELYTYQYDADGFYEMTTMHQPARDITMTEKILYQKNRKGYTAFKELAPHHLPAADENLGAIYSKVPFSAVFKESETDWNVSFSTNGWYIDGKKEADFVARQGKLIHLHSFDHFYDLYSGFLEYTCKIENQDEIKVEVNEKDGLPYSIAYSFSCPEENDKWSLKYIEKSPTKVIMEWNGICTLEHLGHEIAVTKEDQYGIEHFTLSGQLTLQQAIMMVLTQSYLWWDDFEQEKFDDWLMYPYRVNPVPLKFIYTKTENGIERVLQEIKIEDNKTEGTLQIGKPDWLQSNETPRDPDGQKMEFVAQLDHSNMFGTLFLFYSEKHQLVSQIFQCT
ncbi:hypothetical protein [Flavobacterium cerinum]|uniref:Uncharacterized protein n=1 Tax=Flavobacterium cerinum TaxID=2502784 RepID=A0ABY5IRJ3_9FLAO|nr:hypothetical protein [Flavobacterium cerinum]UUC44900.1 hypothetical protein NOX80_14870 [Flavobacterium cerinum]